MRKYSNDSVPEKILSFKTLCKVNYICRERSSGQGNLFLLKCPLSFPSFLPFCFKCHNRKMCSKTLFSSLRSSCSCLYIFFLFLRSGEFENVYRKPLGQDYITVFQVLKRIVIHEHTFISKKRSITNKINIEKNLIVIFWGEGGWGITIFGNWV